jgi:hypothetical protein
VILYQNDFELRTQNNGNLYTAVLNIPLV